MDSPVEPANDVPVLRLFLPFETGRSALFRANGVAGSGEGLRRIGNSLPKIML